MKILYALAFATMPVAASATTITLSGADLVAARSTDGFNLIYAIDLSQLGFVEVNSVTVRDDANNNNAAGGRRSGFDLDLLAIGDEIDNVFTGDSVTFNAGGVAAGTELRGTTGEAPNLNTGVDEAFASLDALDGQLGPVSGFVSLGRQGELTSTFSRSYFVSDSDFLFVSGFNQRNNNQPLPENFEALDSITIEGVVVPLPASGLLLLGGLAALMAGRRRS